MSRRATAWALLVALAACGSAERRLSLAGMVESPALAEDLEETTADIADLASAIFDVKTHLGLRSEYNLYSRGLRFFLVIDFVLRPSRFFHTEIEFGPRGAAPATTLTYDPASGDYVRRVRIEDEVRVTAQYAWQLPHVTLRYGLKESTFGLGADLRLWRGRIRIATDVFDGSFDDAPRLKSGIDLRIARSIWLNAGVDDLLNRGGALDIQPFPAGMDVPVQFRTLHFGRDYYLGADLRFHDPDLPALLIAIGGLVFGIL